MRTLKLILLISLSLFSLIGCESPQNIKKVAITQIATHPALDSVRTGIIQGLASKGFTDGKNIKIIFKNANGDPSLCLPIAQNFVRDQVDIIIPITTPSALAAAKSTKEIPIVFAGVTKPVEIGLVSSIEKPGKNITGTSDKWPYKKQLILFKEIIPDLKTLGMLYKPGDDVSDVALKEVTEHGCTLNIKVIAMPVSVSTDVYKSATALFSKVDAIYTGLDGLIVENLDSVLKAAREVHKPVFSGDVGTVERGGLATYSISMEELGFETGLMAAEVLGGTPPSKMPIKIVSKGKAVINQEQAKKFNLNLNKITNFTISYIN